jgi:hypothetical protein
VDQSAPATSLSIHRDPLNFLAPASEVRVGSDQVVFKSQVQETTIRLADLTYARPDSFGRPEIVWKSGKKRLNVRGPRLQDLLNHLQKRNPSLKISGLKGS